MVRVDSDLHSSFKAENWSGSAPLQVFNMDEHVDIGPLLTAWSRLHPRLRLS